MSAPAGRVLLLFKGAYDTTVTYTPMDVVKYGVSSYVCIAETTGNVPTNPLYWQSLADGIANITPEELGIGYGIASGSGTDRTATLADYELVTNGIVAVTFAVDVPANATLNINSEGAKAIYYRGSALVANVIRGGDTVTFAYDGTRYNILCIDGGAGHEIENSAGTKLTQRDVMQVTDGLEAVDDSTNQKTKIKMNLPTISLADWNAMTEQEKTDYKASHYRFGVELPDTSGVINAEYMKLLWENPNTTQAFAAQTITLNSADYDFLMCVYSVSTGFSVAQIRDVIVQKGDNFVLQAVSATTSNNVQVASRVCQRSSDTSYSALDAYFQTQGTARATNNAYCIPIVIYGIKASFQFKVNAIATELSTSASHCFLSDNETTVEEKLEDIEDVVTANNAGTAISLSSYTQASPYTCPSDGYMLVVAGNTSGNVIFGRVWGVNGEQLGTMSARGATQGDQQSLFVRKGCKIAPIVNTGTGNNIYFMPLQ